MRLRPDDEVYRVHAVWLGPKGWTLPWTARYAAYGIWLLLFIAVLAIEAVTVGVRVPPVWELAGTVLATYALMGFVDHDRSIGSVLQLLRAETTAPRPVTAARRRRVRARVRVRGGA